MTEIELIKVCEKLQGFMENTNKQIETLFFRTNNLIIDVDKIKKHIKNKESLIITDRRGV